MTRKAVMELINQETSIKMPIRTVGNYLKRWGFTLPKCLKLGWLSM
ncbi:MAG: winged helix-turn-helix domain-containing protein [Candidatus Thiodiazotropha sp. (ex Ustalcina ferruginea)]|nr:winged helix-turn-helix domain-containing protein [Candidatus Thiodiazotropha sp. (ex Ustalcina ferruginea)]